jgi:AcrR family transcriptional regulator
VSLKKPKDRYHHRDLRRALIDGALKLIEREGAGALSLREVAKRAGVTHAAPYRHFADKDALLAAVAEEGFHGLRELMAARTQASPDDARRQLIACGLAYVEYALEHPAHFQVMFTRRANDASAKHPTLDEAASATFDLLRQTVARGQAARRLRGDDPMPLALAAWSLVHGLAHLLVEGRLPTQPAPLTVAQQVIETSLDGLIVPAGKPR